MQLQNAVDTGKPLFLHQRDAHDDFLSIMRAFDGRLGRVSGGGAGSCKGQGGGEEKGGGEAGGGLEPQSVIDEDAVDEDDRRVR